MTFKSELEIKKNRWHVPLLENFAIELQAKSEDFKTEDALTRSSNAFAASSNEPLYSLAASRNILVSNGFSFVVLRNVLIFPSCGKRRL